MSIEEKRKLYKCGDDYQTLDGVLTWEDYMKEHRDKLQKKSKAKTNYRDIRTMVDFIYLVQKYVSYFNCTLIFRKEKYQVRR